MKAGHLNTSNVNVNPTSKNFKHISSTNLNTSNVNVNLVLFRRII